MTKLLNFFFHVLVRIEKFLILGEPNSLFVSKESSTLSEGEKRTSVVMTIKTTFIDNSIIDGSWWKKTIFLQLTTRNKNKKLEEPCNQAPAQLERGVNDHRFGALTDGLDKSLYEQKSSPLFSVVANRKPKRAAQP